MMSYVLPDELERFTALSSQWWNPTGPFKVLHAFNEARLQFITHHLNRLYPSLQSLPILDVGCGGGLVAEPLALLGMDVVGLDPCLPAIEVARAHAHAHDLSIQYCHGSLEDHSAYYPVVLALDVLEHTAHPESFLQNLFQHVLPGGCLFISSINKTPAALVFAKFFAEYVLRLLPMGTHRFSHFVSPATVLHTLKGDMLTYDTAGIAFHPFLRAWRLTASAPINYIMILQKAGVSP